MTALPRRHIPELPPPDRIASVLTGWTRRHWIGLADHLLASQGYEGIKEWVYERRLRLQPVPWAQLAAELRQATSDEVAITPVALRQWFIDEISAEHATDAASADGGRPVAS